MYIKRYVKTKYLVLLYIPGADRGSMGYTANHLDYTLQSMAQNVCHLNRLQSQPYSAVTIKTNRDKLSLNMGI